MDALESSLRGHLKATQPKLPDDFAATSDFRDWGLDSLDLVEFVARVERDFRIVIPDDDLPQFISLEATASYLRARMA